MPTRTPDRSTRKKPKSAESTESTASADVASADAAAADAADLESIRALGVDRVNHRTLDADFDGDVYIWDVDKTYLDTQFDTFKGLMRIPFEAAVDKRAFPGTAQLLRELRRGPGKQSISAPLYFISGSPPRLRAVLEKKMLLDGVEFDGLTLKDPVQNMRRGGFRALKAQLAYKLVGLLLHRREFPEGAREMLFGDDVESDAIIYALYADVVAGRMRGAELLRILQRHRTEYHLAEWVVSFADRIPAVDSVQCFFIHLARAADPERFAAFGPSLIAVHDSLQSTLVLAALGKISSEGAVRVAAAMRESGATDIALLASVLDAYRRKLVGGPALDGLLAKLADAGHLPAEVRFAATAVVPTPGRAPSNQPILPSDERA